MRRRKWSRRQVYEILELERRMPIARDRAGRPIEIPEEATIPIFTSQEIADASQIAMDLYLRAPVPS